MDILTRDLFGLDNIVTLTDFSYPGSNMFDVEKVFLKFLNSKEIFYQIQFDIRSHRLISYIVLGVNYKDIWEMLPVGSTKTGWYSRANMIDEKPESESLAFNWEPDGGIYRDKNKSSKV